MQNGQCERGLFNLNNKEKMKFFHPKHSLLLLFGILLISACNKPKTIPKLQDAVITGFDYRKCACCGGLVINFQNRTNSYEGEFRLISNDPAEFGITDSTAFPVYMKVRWEHDMTRCSGNYIKILEFQK